MHIIAVKTGKRPSRTQSKKTSQVNKAFSHDVTAAILVFRNNETAAMWVYQDNRVGDEFFSFEKKNIYIDICIDPSYSIA